MSLTQHTMSTLWLPLTVLAVLVFGALWWWWRSRQSEAEAQELSRTLLSSVQSSAVDTAGPRQPQAALVLGTIERKAYRLLRESFPRAEVLAHVQLLRFIRLPPRDQRETWMQGAGVLDVDLLLCDARFRVLAAIDVRTRRDTPAGKKRSERMVRVLEASGIPVHIWHEESLPNVAEVRRTIAPMLAERKAKAKALEAAKAQAGLLPATSAPDSTTSEPAAPEPDRSAHGRGLPEGATVVPSTGIHAPIDFTAYRRAAARGRAPAA